MRKIFLLSLPALLISNCAIAQDSIQVTTLREVVVSASRTEQPVIEIPRSVTVIGEDEIKNSVYQSVGDLLNAQSGLYIVGTNQTPGTNQNIFMRGMNSNQVAVLIDGVRITDPSSPNAAIDFSEMSLTNIDRIEVIRGSHSTIFGGAAVGGVINIITRKGAHPGFHGDVSWQGGLFGKDASSSTENVDLNYGSKNGFYANGSLFQQNVNGLNAAEISETNPSFTADRDDFRKTDASVKAGFKKDVWDANISFKNTHQYTEIDNGAFSDDENNYLTFDRKLLQYSGGYNLGAALRLSLLGSFSESERFYEDDSSRVSPTTWDHVFSTGTYYGKLQTHELQLNYKGEGVKAVFGTGLYHEKMFFDSYILFNDPQFPFESTTNYDSLDTRTTTGYIFGQVGYDIGNINFSAGARLSAHTTAGQFFTFDFNPSYAYRDLLLYFSLSTGFNAPSLYQLYDPSKNFGAYTTRGNSNLKTEESISLEVGVKKEFSSGNYFTLSAYHTEVKNSIEYVYLWNGDKAIQDLDFSDDRGDTYINVGRQQVAGLELEGLLRVSPAFSVQGNFSVLEAAIQADPDDIEIEQTGGHHVQLYNLGTFLDKDFEQDEAIRRPGFTAFAKLNYQPSATVTIHAAYRYTGERFDATYDETLGPYGALSRIAVEAYHLVDAGVNWRATPVFSVSFKVENVLDEDYREVAGFNTRGRSAYLKLTARF